MGPARNRHIARDFPRLISSLNQISK
jgi:hypothetical protein